MKAKLFVGQKLRALRHGKGWTLRQSAEALDVSISYLSQIEGDQRPASSQVLMKVMQVFSVSAASLEANDHQRVVADLREALHDAGPAATPVPFSELRQAVAQAPTLARRYLEIHQAYRRLEERLNATEAAISLDETAAASSRLPYEEVRDFFHFKDNYLHSLDTAAEALAGDMAGFGQGETALAAYLKLRFDVSTAIDAEADTLRRYDPGLRQLSLNRSNTSPSRGFQIAYQIAALGLGDLVEDELGRASLRSLEAVNICRIGLLNYAAGALVMPYRRFLAEARRVRHDMERIALSFDVSLEQACHRLSTLQRPGERGLAFYFVRTDYAGNITKRHSATRFRFARFGGSCPLWNIHEAVGSPERFLVQLAEMPDGVRYLCVARSVIKPSGSYEAPQRRYVLGFGCEATDAREVVYGDGLDLSGPAAKIGVSCRICERDRCAQRSFPPVDRRLMVMENERAIVPFQLT